MLSTVQIEALRDEIEKDPAGVGYSSLVSTGNDGGVVALLNTPSVQGLKPNSALTERGILDVLGLTLGDQFLTSVETAAASSALLTRAVRILRDYSGAGIDFGSGAVQFQLDALVAAGVITKEIAAALKAYGTRLWSRAELLFGAGTVIDIRDVAAALRPGTVSS